MGTEAITLPRLRIDWAKARNFALIFDENPAHITGAGNEVLPPNSVSGLYAALIILRHLFKDDAQLVCADDLRVRWLRPIVGDDVLTSIITVVRENRSRLDPANLDSCERLITVTNQHSQIVMLINIRQIRKVVASHVQAEED